LSAVLEDEGYIVETVDTAKKSMEKTETSFFNLALIDICLPDMEGVDLLPKLRETSPRLRKIIITGYPTPQNSVVACNRGADAYIMKPFDVKNMLQTIMEKLKKQNEKRKFNEKKVAEFIETRVKELETQEHFAKGHV
jgi:two-component system response regulator AtoC